jgi:prepilin-type N-terminal cleavage/methylation domain-containing protein
MAWTPDKLSTRASDERGFALVELVIVCALLGVVLSAILVFGDTAQQLVPKEQERAMAIQQAQTGIFRMTRELRQAHQVNTATPLVLDVNFASSNVNRTVRYDCSQAHPTVSEYSRCVRIETGRPNEVVVDRVLNKTSVFTYTTNTDGAITYVRVAIDVPARGERAVGSAASYEHQVGLYDGFYMRNLDG